MHTHRVTVLAAHAAGLDQLYPDAGAPWQPRALHLATHPHSVVPALRAVVGERKTVYSVPDEQVTATVDVRPWIEQKTAAVLAHRSEVERGALPGASARLPPDVREELFGTEWYTRHSLMAAAPSRTDLTS
jgi:N-acetyl-1-D-myo-inositol-2-amino-2-deoxy-alpha-D-glucopyranoside deacetylase